MVQLRRCSVVGEQQGRCYLNGIARLLGTACWRGGLRVSVVGGGAGSSLNGNLERGGAGARASLGWLHPDHSHHRVNNNFPQTPARIAVQARFQQSVLNARWPPQEAPARLPRL